jgi:N-carbamoylputrescine amidase
LDSQPLRVTVCELNDEPEGLERDWAGLVEHVRADRSQWVLLPEMVFAPWFARVRPFDPAVWQAALAAQAAWEPRLSELAPAVVVGSRPAEVAGQRRNQAFVAEPGHPLRAVHEKRYLPDEDAFWEASWYGRGDGHFVPAPAGPACTGLLLCTDLWFFEHARALGQAGAHLLANPRGSERASVDKWLAGGRVAAVVAGAFCLSSNRVSHTGVQPPMGGQGWIIGPDGNVLGLTSQAQPYLTLEIDLAEAVRARQTYPRYVLA